MTSLPHLLPEETENYASSDLNAMLSVSHLD